MSVTILVCTCGRRLKATGLAPGKSGRCPSCGALIRVPVPDAPPAPPVASGEDDEWNWQGNYDLGEAVRPLPLRPFDPGPPPEPADRWPDDIVPSNVPESAPPQDSGTADDEWSWHGTNYDLGAVFSRPDESRVASQDEGPGPAPAPVGWTTKEMKPRTPEPWFPPRLFYPFRGAEGIAMVVTLGLAFWVMAALVPAYCLAIQADAEMLGTPLMGYLIALISALPTVILIPMVLVYWLQYLGRVLTASFEGESLPPRPPDRNFDGLLDGVGSWLLWAVLGLGVGFLPLGAYWAAATTAGALPWNPVVALVAGLLGFPYALMALGIVFLHDDPMEAKPGAVLGGIGRLLPSFLGLCLTIATLLGPTAGTFAAACLLRSRSVWLFIGLSLPGWLLAAWSSLVAVHTLGSYYGSHQPKSRPTRSRATQGQPVPSSSNAYKS